MNILGVLSHNIKCVRGAFLVKNVRVTNNLKMMQRYDGQYQIKNVTKQLKHCITQFDFLVRKHHSFSNCSWYKFSQHFSPENWLFSKQINKKACHVLKQEATSYFEHFCISIFITLALITILDDEQIFERTLNIILSFHSRDSWDIQL